MNPSSASLLPPLDPATLTVLLFVVLLTTAAIMTLVGLTQRTYRGYGRWTVAQWANTAAALCLLLKSTHPWLLPMSALLTLQWPLTMLSGMRLFYVRSHFRSSAWTDTVLALIAAGMYMAVWWSVPSDVGARVAAYSAASVLAYSYAAWQVTAVQASQRDHGGPYLRTILVILIAAAVVQLPRMWTALQHWGMPLLDAGWVQQPFMWIATIVGAMGSVYMCLLLTYERTELELRESHRQLRRMAEVDWLTHIPHRRPFEEMALQALSLSTPGGATLMRFDLMGFRDLTVEFGHAAGDDALRCLAASARSVLRSRDLLGRLGGEAFVALLPETRVNDALHVADRIVRHLDKIRLRDQRAALSLNFGVVQMRAAESLEQAIQRADQAMQHASRHGHNQIVTASGEDSTPELSASQQLGAGKGR